MFTFGNSFLSGENELLLTNKEAVWVWLLRELEHLRRYQGQERERYSRPNTRMLLLRESVIRIEGSDLLPSHKFGQNQVNLTRPKQLVRQHQS